MDRLVRSAIAIAAAAAAAGWVTAGATRDAPSVPQFKVDPYWPKPLPQEKAPDGQMRRWQTGEVGGVCVDSHDHIITMNRGWQNDSLGGLVSPVETMSGMPAPPVVVYDTEGKMIASWGDASFLAPKRGTKVMPEGFHGCFVDYEDNVWMAGNADGVVQKYTNDGRKMLLQIGTKGQCDGHPDRSPRTFFPSCGEPGNNSSKTMLNNPADIWVDPNPDPVTRKRGSVYIADGYGNYRVVVFDNEGHFLRQWGAAGDGEGEFARSGGGHPHCVALSNDGFVYACDRGHNRIFVYDKLGSLKRTIAVDPPGGLVAQLRTNDISFSTDAAQAFIYTTDAGNAQVQIINRSTGIIAGAIGLGPGRQAGMLTTPHQLAVDSKGNVYVAETISSRRIQKFVKQ